MTPVPIFLHSPKLWVLQEVIKQIRQHQVEGRQAEGVHVVLAQRGKRGLKTTVAAQPRLECIAMRLLEENPRPQCLHVWSVEEVRIREEGLPLKPDGGMEDRRSAEDSLDIQGVVDAPHWLHSMRVACYLSHPANHHLDLEPVNTGEERRLGPYIQHSKHEYIYRV